ncbi:MAG: hypothetical protein A3K19_27485 [Lentisphaerae bacterium RIFOXYB12_FULL_65_16]|nr:MAG: hypothetical protein A3K18_06330 [Lentisphaerae bacterium RIFOXYA12_64_32]OGV86455.1 MAG: hypothetical protein A3K19_27485 [Lentisphaerae bacterium RIFOXYB12_FULL_65_16]
MRYAIVSDLHANLQAWNAVLTDIRSSGVEDIICLGDIVGYGPQPAEVLSRVYGHVRHFVLGNHDAVVCGQMDAACFNPDARTIIEWTRSRLDGKAADFFAKLPYAIEGRGFRCTHGAPLEPRLFRYVIEPEDALAAWEACSEQLLFLGHSHVPGLFVLGSSGMPHWLPPQNFGMEEGKRYIVNVGSVGQPRDGDIRACYCIYDVERESVNFRRVPFDIEAFRQSLEAAGIPDGPSRFLRVADQVLAAPLREQLDFRPPETAGPETETGKHDVEKLDEVLRSGRRWRTGAITLSALLLLALIVAAGLFAMRTPRGHTYAATAPTDLAGLNPLPGTECLDEPEAVGTMGPKNRLRHWTVMVTDPERQAVLCKPDASSEGKGAAATVVRLHSEKLAPMSFESAPLPARTGMRFTFSGSFCKQGFRSGNVEFCLIQTLPDGTEKLIEHRPLDDLKNDAGWDHVSVTMKREDEGLHEDGPVRLVLRGEFFGEILARKLSLMHREYHPQ